MRRERLRERGDSWSCRREDLCGQAGVVAVEMMAAFEFHEVESFRIEFRAQGVVLVGAVDA